MIMYDIDMYTYSYNQKLAKNLINFITTKQFIFIY
jgi:hypothetical protein